MICLQKFLFVGLESQLCMFYILCLERKQKKYKRIQMGLDQYFILSLQLFAKHQGDKSSLPQESEEGEAVLS